MVFNDTMLSSALTIRHLTSIDYIIKTKAINDLEEKILQWLSRSVCGSIIYGRARIGKTRAMLHAANTIRDIYEDIIPVIIWDITDHAITEKNFYASLLMAMGVSHPNRGMTALILKERVLNELIILGNQGIFKKVIIMIDEAWKLSIKDFNWLMDLYNNLNHRDIQLICFLFGTRELKSLKNMLKNEGKDQIVGRFMVNEFQFYGMKDINELVLCLLNLDKEQIQFLDKKKDVSLLDFYFPNASMEGKSFVSLANEYWNGFTKIQSKYNFTKKDIPMKYFIDSFVILLTKYGALSHNRVAFPGKKELEDCIIESGYRESDEQKGKKKLS